MTEQQSGGAAGRVEKQRSRPGETCSPEAGRTGAECAEEALAPGGAIILAGGKSSRMGRDKALLAWQGQTLVERCLTAVRPVASEVVLVTDLSDRLSLPGCRTIVDLFPGAGPVGGILTGLIALGEGHHLVVACDMPLLRTDLLRVLRRQAGDEDVVVPYIEGRPEPLCALYRHTAIPKLERFLAAGQRAAHKALETLEIRRIDEETLRTVDPALAAFTNINTPEDFARLNYSQAGPPKHPGETQSMPSKQETIRVQLNYPQAQVDKPILYRLVTDFHLIPNIRRANMDQQSGGFIFLELSGRQEELDRALLWLQAAGIGVDAIGLDGAEEWVV